MAVSSSDLHNTPDAIQGDDCAEKVIEETAEGGALAEDAPTRALGVFEHDREGDLPGQRIKPVLMVIIGGAKEMSLQSVP